MVHVIIVARILAILRAILRAQVAARPVNILAQRKILPVLVEEVLVVGGAGAHVLMNVPRLYKGCLSDSYIVSDKGDL